MFFGKNPSILSEEIHMPTLRDPGSRRSGYGYTAISAPPFTSKERAAEA